MDVRARELSHSTEGAFRAFSFMSVLGGRNHFLFVRFRAIKGKQEDLYLTRRSQTSVTFTFYLRRANRIIMSIRRVRSPRNVQIRLNYGRRMFIIRQDQFSRLQPCAICRLILSFFFSQAIAIESFLCRANYTLASLNQVRSSRAT